MARQKAVLPDPETLQRIDAWREAIERIIRDLAIVEKSNPALQNYISRIGEDMFQVESVRYTTTQALAIKKLFGPIHGFACVLGAFLKMLEEGEYDEQEFAKTVASLVQAETGDRFDTEKWQRLIAALNGVQTRGGHAPVGANGSRKNGATHSSEN